MPLAALDRAGFRSSALIYFPDMSNRVVLASPILPETVYTLDNRSSKNVSHGFSSCRYEKTVFYAKSNDICNAITLGVYRKRIYRSRNLQFRCAGKIPNDRIFRHFYHIIPAAEYSHWIFNHCTKYSAGHYLLSASRKKVLYQFFTVYGAFFFDDRLCGTVVSGISGRPIISSPLYRCIWRYRIRTDLFQKTLLLVDPTLLSWQ